MPYSVHITGKFLTLCARAPHRVLLCYKSIARAGIYIRGREGEECLDVR